MVPDFDVVALGANLGTLVAAALMARGGRRVLLVPGRINQAQIRFGSHSIDSRTDLLAGHDRPLAIRCIEELGLTDFLRRRLRPCDPPLQIVYPDRRIDVSDDEENLLEEFQRELVASRAELDRLLVKVAQASRVMERILEQGEQWLVGQGPLPELESDPLLPLDSPMVPIVYGPSAMISPLVHDQIGELAVARLFSNWRRGTFALTGGMSSLQLELESCVREAGGEVLHNSDLLGMVQRRGRVRGVIVEGRPGTIIADQFLLGLDPERLRKLLEPPATSRLPRAVEVARRYSLHFIFRRGWLPASMGPQLLLVSKTHETLWGADLLRVVAQDQALTADEEVLSVQAVVPISRCDRQGLRELRNQIMIAVRGLVPFFDDCFLCAVSAYDDLGPVGPQSGNVDWSRGAVMESVFDLGQGRLSFEGDSLLPAAPLDLGVPELALVHPLVLGSVGTEGELTAAMLSRDLLSGRRPRRPE